MIVHFFQPHKDRVSGLLFKWMICRYWCTIYCVSKYKEFSGKGFVILLCANFIKYFKHYS
jgi:hypothetical protein